MGGVVFVLTVTVPVFVHPLLGSETVTVYVPAAFTVGLDVVAFAVIPEPVHKKVAPVVVELAVIVPVKIEQVRDKGLPAVTVGKTPLDVTTTVEVLVQLLEGSVTVTV